MADFGGTDLEAFRAEAREWIAANFPAALKGKPQPDDAARSAIDARRRPGGLAQGHGRQGLGRADLAGGLWRRRALARRGAACVQQELNRAGAYNPIGGMGVMMFGPTLLEYGTEAQKQEHIPPIVRGEVALVPGLLRAGRRLRPRQSFRPRPRTRATTS